MDEIKTIQFPGREYNEWDGGYTRDELVCVINGCIFVTIKKGEQQ